MDKDIQSKISQLSMLEQNMQSFAGQRQQYQAQLLEIESAQKEIASSKEAYKIIGNIMVARTSEQLKQELDEKKEVVALRIESFEKQETKLREKAEALQKEIVSEMKKGE